MRIYYSFNPTNRRADRQTCLKIAKSGEDVWFHAHPEFHQINKQPALKMSCNSECQPIVGWKKGLSPNPPEEIKPVMNSKGEIVGMNIP